MTEATAHNVHSTNSGAAMKIDRQASVMSSIQALHDNYNTALDTITEQNAEIEQWKNRTALLVDDRDHFRKEAGRYRAQSIELATIVANIALLTMRAQEIIKVIHDDEDHYNREVAVAKKEGSE